VPRPELPEERRKLPSDVYRDLKAGAREGTLDDAAAAFAAAGDALAEDDPATALRYLGWVKSVAPRSAVVREALGVAFYQAGELEAARAELQTYRRISGRLDQNHLLADCVRAQGRPDKVESYVDEMLSAPGVPAERRSEAVIVLAGARADAGDVEGALAALTRVPLADVPAGEPLVRRWYLEAVLEERLGHDARARELLEEIAEVDEQYLDVAERLGR
jgi:tetratricopeptide (TPR) repeat protein